MSDRPDHQLEALLEYMKLKRGFDFTAYKRSTLQRRIEKRIQALNLASIGEYLAYLEKHPNEFVPLFNVVLINITEFFRDPPAWEYVAAEIVPQIIQDKGRDAAIRVWSAGCASGEEPYSITMLFAEALGLERLRHQFRVYATDIDEDALTAARHGVYPASALEHVPPHLVEKYFEQHGDRYSFHRDARRSVIFAKHDLVRDPPISRIDLIVCRNTLMYFTSEAQSRILARFHFALNEPGYLFAGRAEMLLTHSRLFTVVNAKRRVFRKVPNNNLAERVAMLAHADNAGAGPARGTDVARYALAFEVKPLAQVLLDARGNLVAANEAARRLLGLSTRDEGRPLWSIETPALPAEVLRATEQSLTQSAPTTLKDIVLAAPSGESRFYEVGLVSLRDRAGTLVGVSLTFDDVTSHHDLQEQLQRCRQELETMSEELQSSNEELETTNEELQSTIEELETTNEELQSTNEELETMNEELQSTNEELHTSNDELRARGEELSQTNAFLHAILSSIRSALIVVDTDSRVLTWSRGAEDLWGLRAEEAQGKSFFNLDIGLPVDQLARAVRTCLGGEPSEVMLQAVNRRGRTIACKVCCTPLRGARGDTQGAILLVEDQGPPG